MELRDRISALSSLCPYIPPQPSYFFQESLPTESIDLSVPFHILSVRSLADSPPWARINP